MSILVVVVVVIHYNLIYISSIIGDVYRYGRLATIQLLVYRVGTTWNGTSTLSTTLVLGCLTPLMTIPTLRATNCASSRGLAN